MNTEREPPRTSRPTPGTAAAGKDRQPPSALESRALFQGATEVLIRHGNETYRLRQTQAGKLILTK